MSDDIVISAAGAVSGVGTGCAALRGALLEGRDGIRRITRFDVTLFRTQVAALWPEWEGRTSNDDVGDGGFSTTELAVRAASEALAGARLRDVRPDRIAVIVGTCFGENFAGFSELADGVAKAIGATGPALTVSTACSSSTSAIGLARELVASGRADVVFAGGADILSREVFAGFHALGALSANKCTPFGPDAGTTLAEGAGFVVVEREQSATARGLAPWAHVLGFGVSSDAHHETAPDPSGSGLARSLASALREAELPPDAIDFVSAHGTGTATNDVAESAALATVFGARLPSIPVSSTKSFLGHAQGAAGVLELIAALLCRREGLIPPTLRCTAQRPGTVSDPVASDRPRKLQVRNLAKVSAAFGGANAALILGDRPPRQRNGTRRRTVEVAGVGVVGPFGEDLPTLEAAISGRHGLTGPPRDLELDRLLRVRIDRTLDPSATALLGAAGLALAHAKISIRGGMRDRAGLFTGTDRMPAKSKRETRESIDDRGLLAVATGPFSRMVLNAPAGVCARTLSLRGPLLVLSAGRCSGLFAIARAAEHQAGRDDADLIAAGGHDEVGEWSPSGGAAMAVLRATHEPPRTVSVTGSGIAGGGHVDTAIREAMGASAGGIDQVLSLGPIPGTDLALDLLPVLHGFESCASSLLFALAVGRILRQEARRILVVAQSEGMSCAVMLAAPGV